MTKVTKKDYFNAMRTLLKGGDHDTPLTPNITIGSMLEFIDKEIENLSKKNASVKPKVDKNADIKEHILNFFEVNQSKFRISEITLGIEAGVGEVLSSQKMSAILNQLVNSGMIKKVIEKRVTYFAPLDFAEVEEEEVID